MNRNRKRLLLSALSLAFITSCASALTSPLQQLRSPQARFFARSEAPVPPKQIEDLVSKERIAEHLAALTGVRPIAPNTVIPERGTRQGRHLTRQFIQTYLESLGYEVERHEYRRNGINMITRLMADEPTDEYIVVGAHMDSVRNAGADDNGSGSSAVLEAATVLRELKGRKVNLIFAWFDEEELGLIGSRHLAREYRRQKLNITSMHNVDMLGYDGDGDGVIELARPAGILWDYYNMVNRSHGLNLPLERTSTSYSDHVSFEREGYDSLMLIEEYTTRDMTPHYHRQSDQFHTINLDYLTAGTRLMIATVGDLVKKVPPPPGAQFVPHEHFPSRERDFHKSYDEFVTAHHGH